MPSQNPFPSNILYPLQIMSTIAGKDSEGLSELDAQRFLEAWEMVSEKGHAENVRCGWWTDPKNPESGKLERNKGELLALIHSEISEAFEAYALNSRDDKLPQYWGRDVEIADAGIRLADLCGAYYQKLSADALPALMKPVLIETDGFDDETNNFSIMHLHVSRMLECARKGRDPSEHIARLLREIFYIGPALIPAWMDKCVYNQNREDHKLTSRAADDGKKFWHMPVEKKEIVLLTCSICVGVTQFDSGTEKIARVSYTPAKGAGSGYELCQSCALSFETWTKRVRACPDPRAS
jgi:hypothetical protein